MAAFSLDLDETLRHAAASLATTGLGANPFARLTIVRDGAQFDFQIDAPVPGAGLQRTAVRPNGDPALHAWLLQLMIPGASPAGGRDIATRLQRAGVLIPVERVPEPVAFDWPHESFEIFAADPPAVLLAELTAARAAVPAIGFAETRGLVPQPWLGALQRYYAALVAGGFLAASDDQSHRYTAHDEPIAAEWHRLLWPLVSRAIPEPIRPTYSYLGLYRPGAVLERHTDREECEYTLSLTIDARPSAARDDAWPLCLELPDGRMVRSLLAPGDGLLFKGRDLPHYREALPQGRTSWSVFFHFIPSAHR